MRYASEDADNRAIVKALYLDEDNENVSDDAGEVLSRAYRVPYDLVDQAKNALNRRDVLQNATDEALYLAVWKAVSPTTEWRWFLIQLKANRVTVRDVDAIRRAVEDEFEVLLEEANQSSLNTSRIVLNNVKSYVATHRRDGVTLVIHLYPGSEDSG